jgi:hypothetical protein
VYEDFGVRLLTLHEATSCQVADIKQRGLHDTCGTSLGASLGDLSGPLTLDTAMLSVALLFYAVRLSAGEGRGMPSVLAGLGLLPVAALTLRSRYTGKPSR